MATSSSTSSAAVSVAPLGGDRCGCRLQKAVATVPFSASSIASTSPAPSTSPASQTRRLNSFSLSLSSPSPDVSVDQEGDEETALLLLPCTAHCSSSSATVTLRLSYPRRPATEASPSISLSLRREGPLVAALASADQRSASLLSAPGGQKPHTHRSPLPSLIGSAAPHPHHLLTFSMSAALLPLC